MSEREGEEYTICTRFCAAELATTSPVQIAGSHTACSRPGSGPSTWYHQGLGLHARRRNRKVHADEQIVAAEGTRDREDLGAAARAADRDVRVENVLDRLRSSSVTVVLITSTRRILSIARSFFLSTPAERTAVKIGLV